MPRQRQVEQYEQMVHSIKQSARDLMCNYGTAGLSLRAIAKSLDVSPMALYHYFPNLEALITALIVDAFNAQADMMSAAQNPSDTNVEQLLSLLSAYRQWALENPLDFQLIYGNPIPGYVAPPEVTVPAASRSFLLLATHLQKMFVSGEIAATPLVKTIPAALHDQLINSSAAEGHHLAPEVLQIFLFLWSFGHGAVMLELLHHTSAFVKEPSLLFDVQLRALLTLIGIAV